MPSFEVTDEIEINAPAATIFNVVSDYPGWNKWLPVYNCELLDTDEFKVGTKISHRMSLGPVGLASFIRQINNIEPDSKLEESYLEGDMTGTGIWRFEENNGKTLASYECKVTSAVPATHVSFALMGKHAHSMVYKSVLKKLKAHCENL